MNKIAHKTLFFVILFVISFSTQIYANEWKLTPRIGCYYLTSSKQIREVYGRAAPFYQVELARTFNDGNWEAFAGVGYVTKSGHSSGEHDKTRFQIVPVEFGANYIWKPSCHYQFFIGGGPTYSWLFVDSHSHFVKEHVRKGAWGGVVKSGASYIFCSGIQLELFVDYMYTRFDFSKKHSCNKWHDFVSSNLLFGVGVTIPFCFY